MLGSRTEKITFFMLISPLVRCQLWSKKWQITRFVRLWSYPLFGIAFRKLPGSFSYRHGYVFCSVFCLAFDCPMPLHISKMMVFSYVLWVFWHIFFLPQMFSWHLFACLLCFRAPDIQPLNFVDFGTTFWVFLRVILSTFIEQTAQRNTCERNAAKADRWVPASPGSEGRVP